jgi:DNA polymerase
MSGRVASLKPKKIDESRGNCQPSYNVSVWLTPGNCHEISKKPTITDFKGKVFCAQTQSGYFLVRREGRVWVTGNSGRLIQMQNLRRNSIEDLAVARALVKGGDYEAVKLLYGNVPDTLSQLVRTAFIPRKGYRFIVADFSAIEARVLSWLAGETWRMDIFAEDGDIYCASASQMFKVPVEKHGLNAHLRQKGKVSELALGYNGSVGALKAMGALEMGLEEIELKPLVDAWRQSNPNIVQLWWDVDKAAKGAVREKTTTNTHGIKFSYESGFLFITIPSSRRLAYVKPRIGTNDFGSDCVTYEGVGATKKWERIDTFGGKLVENIIQAISRDLLCHAMQQLETAGCHIVMHIHDEVVIEAPKGMDVDEVGRIMSIVPSWVEGLMLSAAGYEAEFYMKD